MFRINKNVVLRENIMALISYVILREKSEIYTLYVCTFNCMFMLLFIYIHGYLI
jgi:hypothetical protein